ncbi:hypothetical protein Y032_0248g102 [Ancylostoma ceylanicum]|uniref:Uncharacterized protein n=1 Tax=Ancylostoma ceylanicum TaxID=53326 RepID=A0A016SD95_9BILA|nr:hypothetical protein Y032_0248g102 [Ancylostoma ceylanicum]
MDASERTTCCNLTSAYNRYGFSFQGQCRDGHTSVIMFKFSQCTCRNSSYQCIMCEQALPSQFRVVLELVILSRVGCHIPHILSGICCTYTYVLL